MKFTIDELNTLIQLLDIATKAGGLSVANQALPLAAKMQQMAQEIQNDASLIEEESMP